LASLRQERKAVREFQSVPTGSKGCMFVRTTNVDPAKLVRWVYELVGHKKEAISRCCAVSFGVFWLNTGLENYRYIQKMTPVTQTCKASVEVF
jgi:hypothetical protein